MATQLKIDDFEFKGFEVPDFITFGGAQCLAVHKLPGGERIIDSLGRDDAPLEWEGVFTGKSALSRAQFLDGYRVRGAIHKLTWGTFSFNVVIREFRPKYERAFHIPYRIVCEVVEDLTTPVTVLAGQDLDAAIREPIESAIYFATTKLQPSLISTIAAGIKSVQAAIAVVQTAMDNVMQGIASVVNLETAAIATVQNAINSALEFVTSCEAMINNGVSGLTGLFGNNGAGTTSGGNATGTQSTALLAQWSTDMANLDALSQIKASLTVANENMGYINGSPNATQVTVVGGNLIDLALEYYGDAKQWTLIAAANTITDPATGTQRAMTDPYLTGQHTITIPPAASTPANIGGGADIDHWVGSDPNLSKSNDMGAVVSGSKSQQRILRRLLTNPGGYVWHPSYGAGILQHIGDTDANLQIIEGIIIAQAQLEQGVSQSPPPSVTFDISGDDVTANIQYTEQATNSRQFLSFTVTP